MKEKKILAMIWELIKLPKFEHLKKKKNQTLFCGGWIKQSITQNEMPVIGVTSDTQSVKQIENIGVTSDTQCETNMKLSNNQILSFIQHTCCKYTSAELNSLTLYYIFTSSHENTYWYHKMGDNTLS